MAKNLLEGVNEVLKKVSIVSDETLLTSLSNSGKQTFIDQAISAWNEAIDQLYSKPKMLRPYQAEEDSITLKTNVRVYDLPSDIVELTWPLHNEIDGLYISEYTGGYEELRHVQTQPANYTGTPFFGALSPIENQVYLDRLPTAGENGDVYTFLYYRDTVLEKAADRFPFEDAVFRALVPVVAEIYGLMQYNRYRSGAAKLNFGRALRLAKKQPAKDTYIKRRGSYQGGPLGFSPFD